MKAAVLHELRQPYRIEDVPRPQIGPGEVLVETHTCGLCGTDMHIQDGLAYVPELPFIPGHEAAGVVTEVANDVTSLQVGQRVVPHNFVTCDECLYCRSGRHAQCLKVLGIFGVSLPGGFAEYFKMPAKNLFVLPENVPFDTGGLVSCAVITAVHAYRRSRINANDAVVVIGSGGIGQLMIQILKFAGAKVIALSRTDASLKRGQQVGADLGVLADAKDAQKQIKDFTDGNGAHCAFDTVGTAATMKVAAESVMQGGQIIVIGEEPDFPAIDTIQIAQRELEIIGSRNGGFQDAIDALEMMSDGIIQPLVAERFSLDDFNAAMDCLRSGKAHGRIVISIKD